MGAVNSNHFLPQAYDAYRHYHELAMQHAKTCQEASEAMSPETESSTAKAYALAKEWRLPMKPLASTFFKMPGVWGICGRDGVPRTAR